MLKYLNKNDYNYINEIEDKFFNVFNKGSIINEYNNNPFNRLLVYLIDNHVVGFIHYYEIYDRIEIANFNVLDFFQKQGIGSCLLNSLIKKYLKKMKNITLEVRKDNIRAINLYKKYGFIQKAIRKNYYNDNIDGLLMEKELM